MRFLFCISNLYSGITKDDNLYRIRKVEIPAPEFVIFYNSEEERPERETLKLSDLYSVKSEEYKLELEAELLNIYGENNAALKEGCRTLREYAVFTDKMRRNAKTMNVEEAADQTIEECIREGVLKDFLTKHRAKTVSIFEYDQEKHIRMEREQAWEDGIIEGERRSKLSLIKKKLAKGKSIAQIADELEEEEAVIRELANSIEMAE